MGLKDCRKYTWEAFCSLPLDERNKLHRRSSDPSDIFHTLNAEQFDRTSLDQIYNLTNIIRSISKTKNGATFLANRLRHQRAMLYFAQASTRTYLVSRPKIRAVCLVSATTHDEYRDS